MLVFLSSYLPSFTQILASRAVSGGLPNFSFNCTFLYSMNYVLTQYKVSINYKVLTVTFKCLIHPKFIFSCKIRDSLSFFKYRYSTSPNVYLTASLFSTNLQHHLCHISDLPKYVGWFSGLSVLFHFCLKYHNVNTML